MAMRKGAEPTSRFASRVAICHKPDVKQPTIASGVIQGNLATTVVGLGVFLRLTGFAWGKQPQRMLSVEARCWEELADVTYRGKKV